ncbi:PD-(D/E)XK nuclease family protein [Thermodesulfovibrio sp.]|uniref:PD-(D/E)XK nuclease family protein n=1 Tax=Thermodesulfovibrio sp. TaxID=2067987 RepID=UPI003C7DDF61
MQTKLTKEEIKRIIITELPKLLKRDALTREYISSLFKEKFADKKQTEDRFEKLLKELQEQRQEWNKRFEQTQAEWNKKWEENEKKWAEWNKRFEQTQAEWNKKWEENEKKWAEWNKRFEQTQAEWNKRWEENQKVINSILEEIKLLHRKHDTTIGALGARWGFRAEASFRDAIKGILEESFPVKVQKYLAKDEEGMVFGRPDQIELDLIVKDGEVIVAEIKSSISKGDVATFLRKVRFYEQKEGVKLSRKLLISPMIDNAAKEFALSSGIEVYGYPEEVEFKEIQSSN